MLVDLSNFDWKLLRILARAGKRPVPGRKLRHAPTRKTQDGSFLTRLVDAGLLSVAAPAPDPFAATYALTPLGRHAAEYGEYEGRMPWEKEKPAKGAVVVEPPEPERPAPKRPGAGRGRGRGGRVR